MDSCPWSWGLPATTPAPFAEGFLTGMQRECQHFLWLRRLQQAESVRNCQHFTEVANSAKRPVILYNVPGRTASNMEATTTLALAQHPNICGIKEASGNLIQIEQIIAQRPEGFWFGVATMPWPCRVWRWEQREDLGVRQCISSRNGSHDPTSGFWTGSMRPEKHTRCLPISLPYCLRKATLQGSNLL